MEVRRSYCSAVDRNVPVVLRADVAAGPPSGGYRTAPDPSALVCLDYKVRCTGWCCPLMSVDDRLSLDHVRQALPATPPDASRPADRDAVPASTLRQPKRWVRPT